MTIPEPSSKPEIISIKELNLSERPNAILRRYGVHYVQDLVQLSSKDLRQFTNLGIKDLDEIIYALDSIDLTLAGPQQIATGILRKPVGELNLSERPYFILRRYGVDYVQDLVQLTPEELSGFTNLGPRSFDEVVSTLDKWELSLSEPEVLENSEVLNAFLDGNSDAEIYKEVATRLVAIMPTQQAEQIIASVVNKSKSSPSPVDSSERGDQGIEF